MTAVQSLSELITSLLNTLPSANDDIKAEIADAINCIGKHQPKTMLKTIHTHLIQQHKLSSQTRSLLLRSVSELLTDSKLLEALDNQSVLLIINLATQEMTMTKENETDWADTAQELLVTISKHPKHVSHVLDAVLQKFPPGLTTQPHRYVIVTLGQIAEHNAEGFVPFLTDILSRSVPLLTSVRGDAARCTWARAMCNFCEAVREVECSAKEKEETDAKEASRTIYSDQMEAVFDAIFSWMGSKDAKVRADSAECIGELCLMIRQQKIVDELKRLVNTLLGLYKKAYSEQAAITQGICRFLEATCYDDVVPLDAYLEELLTVLFPNACLDPDDTTASPSHSAIKNHSEAFRCFHVAATRYADRIVYFLLHKMQHHQDMQRIGAINVMRHLLNSAGSFMEDKRSLVMMGLRKLLAGEQIAAIRVKRAIVQLCVALSDHAYVDAEGGQHVIAFLVRNLVAPSDDVVSKRAPVDDVAGLNQLRTQCAQALHTIASTCVCALKLLWPYLLEFICVKEYTAVLPDLCKCLKTLLVREREEGRAVNFIEGFDNEHVAGRYQVFARLIIAMSGAPLNGLLGRRSREALSLLPEFADWIHPSIINSVEEYSPKLFALLEELPSSIWSSDAPLVGELRWRRVGKWNSVVLSFLSDLIASVMESDWRQEIAAALGKQLNLYKDAQHEKAFALRALGVVLSHITNQPFVIEHIQLMFKSTNHSIAAERVGCARAVGAIARVHVDLILTQLENVSKWEHTKKSQSIFGFIKGSLTYTDIEMVNLRATLMLCYGYVILACPIDTVTQRLEQVVVPFLRNYMANQKQEVVVRECLLETIRLIAEAIHPLRLSAEYIFEARGEWIAYTKDYLQVEMSDMLTCLLRLLGCRALTALIRLSPRLNENDIWDLANILTKAILPISREKSGLKAFFELDRCEGSPATAIKLNDKHLASPRAEDDESSTTMDSTVAQLGITLATILRRHSTLPIATMLLQFLQPFYASNADHERSRAIDLTVLVLREYFDVAEDVQLGRANDFPPLSSLLARMAPRLSDHLHSVRVQALVAMHEALSLAHIFKGHGREKPSVFFNIAEFSKDYLASEGKLEGQTAKKTILKIAQIIERSLPSSQLQTYLSALLEMLDDRQSQVSCAAAQLIAHTLSQRGAILHSEGRALVSSILAKLPSVQPCVQTYTELLAALCAFYIHQQTIVLDILLEQSLPYTVPICDAWKCISRERSLFASSLDHVLELLVESLHESIEVIDIGGGALVHVCNARPLALASALTEFFKGGEPESALEERVPVLLAALLQLLVTVSNTQFPVAQRKEKDTEAPRPLITPELRKLMDKPAGVSTTSIRTLLERVHLQAIIEDMNASRSWSECLDAANFLNAVSVLICSIVEHMPRWAEPLADKLMEYVSSPYEPLRVAAIAVVAELIKRAPKNDGSFDERLLEDCVNALKNTLKDESLRIRKLCVRGLGDLGNCVNMDSAARFTAVAVNASMAALDDVGDRRDEVAMEAILSLNKLVQRASDEQLADILPQVLLKIRPCFEKDSSSLRAASFSLFGELGHRVGNGSHEFAQHLHTNIVAVLLHLGEEEIIVQEACGRCLRNVSILYDNDVFEKLCACSLNASDKLTTSYYEFLHEYAVALAESFPDRVNSYALTCSSYFKAPSCVIRVNAAHFSGNLLSNLSPQLRATVSKELIFTGLVELLKDQNVIVRIAATKAIARLHQFS